MWFMAGFLIAAVTIGVDFITSECEYKKEMDEFNKYASAFIKSSGFEEYKKEIRKLIDSK